MIGSAELLARTMEGLEDLDQGRFGRFVKE